jgi:hypothetical protein
MNKNTAGHQALERLFSIAMRDTGQSRRAGNFLFAWHNAEENGGWEATGSGIFPHKPLPNATVLFVASGNNPDSVWII